MLSRFGSYSLFCIYCVLPAKEAFTQDIDPLSQNTVAAINEVVVVNTTTIKTGDLVQTFEPGARLQFNQSARSPKVVNVQVNGRVEEIPAVNVRFPVQFKNMQSVPRWLAIWRIDEGDQSKGSYEGISVEGDNRRFSHILISPGDIRTVLFDRTGHYRANYFDPRGAGAWKWGTNFHVPVPAAAPPQEAPKPAND